MSLYEAPREGATTVTATAIATTVTATATAIATTVTATNTDTNTEAADITIGHATEPHESTVPDDKFSIGDIVRCDMSHRIDVLRYNVDTRMRTSESFGPSTQFAIVLDLNKAYDQGADRPLRPPPTDIQGGGPLTSDPCPHTYVIHERTT